MSRSLLRWASAWAGDADLQALHARERALLSSRTTARRRAEFVAGRLAARAAVTALTGTDDPDRWVARDAWGAIHLATLDTPVHDVFVSITHAEGLALAAASTERVGVDLVVLEAPSSGLRDETADADEHQRFAAWLSEAAPAEGLRPDSSPLVLFAAKEAALKWLGLGLHAGLRDLVLAPHGEGQLLLQVAGASAPLAIAMDRDADRVLVAVTGPDRAGLRARARDTLQVSPADARGVA